MHMALAEKRRFIRIQPRSDVLGQYAMYVAFQFFCIRMCGKRMQIRHHKITFKFILHAHIIAQCPKVIAQMQKPRGTDATHYYLFFPFFHNRAKITICQFENGNT